AREKARKAADVVLRKYSQADILMLLDKWEKNINPNIARASADWKQEGIPGITEAEYDRSARESQMELVLLEVIQDARKSIGGPDAEETQQTFLRNLMELA